MPGLSFLSGFEHGGMEAQKFLGINPKVTEPINRKSRNPEFIYFIWALGQTFPEVRPSRL